MIILALDTTTRAGSIAVLRGGVVVYEAAGDDAVTHGQRLPSDLMRATDAAGIRIEDVELYAVAAGPGSFTGLRVGIATVQGLAMAHGRRVVAVPVLDALGRSGGGRADLIGAWVDAQRGQVFAALYEADGVAQVAPATAMTPRETLAAWRRLAPPAGIHFIGDGAVRYAAEIALAGGDVGLISPPPLLAPVVGRVAAAAPDTAVLPHAVVPVYVRRPDAELARERRQTVTTSEPGWRVERLTDSAELDDLVALEAASFSRRVAPGQLAKDLRRRDIARIYVLRSAGLPIAAFCACWLVVDELHIHTVAVTPACRGQGMATYLMRHVLAEATADGARRATLEVRASNVAARRLYGKLGFKVAAVRKAYYSGPVEDGLILWRDAAGDPPEQS